MKILHIAEFGLRKTGIGTVIERLYNEQKLLGHNVRIATTSENLAYKYLEIINVNKPEKLSLLLGEWIPDVVVFHSLWCMPYIKMAKILKDRTIPYAVMMHGANSEYNNKKNHLKKVVANFLFFNDFLRGAAKIIYLSKSEYQRCVSNNINPNYAIVPNGCDVVDIDISKKRLSQPVIITYLGRMAIETKGLDYLFGAIKILNDKSYKGARFKFYGNENDVDIIEAKRQIESLSELASFEGPAYGDQKINVLKQTDIFILTSPSEGMPMGVLEALSYGVPCILTPGTNMAEDIVEARAGWKAELDAQSIANTIESAVLDLSHNYCKKREFAYKLSKKYDWKTIALQHVEVLNSLIGES